MPDRQSVINRLNGIHAVACGLSDDQCFINSIGINQLQTLINDATELLKVQEPQVLSVEAVRKLTRIPVWLDVKSTHKTSIGAGCLPIWFRREWGSPANGWA